MPACRVERAARGREGASRAGTDRDGELHGVMPSVETGDNLSRPTRGERAAENTQATRAAPAAGGGRSSGGGRAHRAVLAGHDVDLEVDVRGDDGVEVERARLGELEEEDACRRTHGPRRRRGSARICSKRYIGAIGARCIGTIGMVYLGIPMHSYEKSSQLRALRGGGRGRAGRPTVDFRVAAGDRVGLLAWLPVLVALQ